MEAGGEDKKRKLEDGSSERPLSREDLKKLLDPLTKEQVVDLLLEAGSKFGEVAHEIREVASRDPAHRKLFVRGLAWETDTQSLREAFSQFGEVDEGAVIVDKQTGKSRGFGFITFKHMDSAYRALENPNHMIDGRMTVCNLASQGVSAAQGGQGDVALRKVFIGGLAYETTIDTLLKVFGQYGEIEDGTIAYDRNTNKSRGYGFVTFKTVEGARRSVQDSGKTIDGRQVQIKIAAEGQREKQQQLQQQMQQQAAAAQGVQQVSSAAAGLQAGYITPQLGMSMPQYRQGTGAQGLAYLGSLAGYGSAQPQYAQLSGLTGSGNGQLAAQGQFAGGYTQYVPGQASLGTMQGGLGAAGNVPLYYTGPSLGQ